MDKQDSNKTILQHIEIASKKVATWPDWQKKVVEQRVLSNNQPFKTVNN
jgi:hypothetical protein